MLRLVIIFLLAVSLIAVGAITGLDGAIFIGIVVAIGGALQIKAKA